LAALRDLERAEDPEVHALSLADLPGIDQMLGRDLAGVASVGGVGRIGRSRFRG
jgi:hypothetical protein